VDDLDPHIEEEARAAVMGSIRTADTNPKYESQLVRWSAGPLK
jgi:hypothetical protein